MNSLAYAAIDDEDDEIFPEGMQDGDVLIGAALDDDSDDEIFPEGEPLEDGDVLIDINYQQQQDNSNSKEEDNVDVETNDVIMEQEEYNVENAVKLEITTKEKHLCPYKDCLCKDTSDGLSSSEVQQQETEYETFVLDIYRKFERILTWNRECSLKGITSYRISLSLTCHICKRKQFDQNEPRKYVEHFLACLGIENVSSVKRRRAPVGVCIYCGQDKKNKIRLSRHMIAKHWAEVRKTQARPRPRPRLMREVAERSVDIFFASIMACQNYQQQEKTLEHHPFCQFFVNFNVK